jgi:predicted amidohydrolase
VLLRARAIENQCFVVAAAQAGQHHATRASYGHGMVRPRHSHTYTHTDSYTQTLTYAHVYMR